MLKPQDIVVTLKLLTAAGAAPLTFAQLADELSLSVSEVHAAVKRAAAAGFLVSRDQAGAARGRWLPVKSALREFLVFGLKYVWPVRRSATARGMLTGTSLPMIAERLGLASPEMPLVWPDAEGEARGESLKPLFPKVIQAARRDPQLHEWLALLDVVRAGGGRESSLAASEIQKRLQ